MLLAFFGYVTWTFGLICGVVLLSRLVKNTLYLNELEQIDLESKKKLLDSMSSTQQGRAFVNPDSSHPEIAEIQKGDQLIGIAFDGQAYPPLPEDEEGEPNDNKIN